ncbi:MlaD family protein [Nonomuraea salmonea]|uniref:MlaD family protein n=1 Tax=Nonomuraea salmonea TaxID=46181 RepID=UPI002FE946AC
MNRSELSLSTRLCIALAMLVVLAGTVLYAVRTATEVPGTRYDAVFGRAGQGLDAGSPVKIRGITVGEVTDVSLDAKGRAVVTMHVDDAIRVPRTATASVEPASVFGPKFVDLRPGRGEARGPYLAAGAVITRTEDPLDLSDTLGDAYRGLKAVNPREVTVIVHTLAKGLEGQGEDLRELIGDAGTVMSVAHRQRFRARRFLRDGALLGTALSGKGDELVAISSDVNVITPRPAQAGRQGTGSAAGGHLGLRAGHARPGQAQGEPAGRGALGRAGGRAHLCPTRPRGRRRTRPEHAGRSAERADRGAGTRRDQAAAGGGVPVGRRVRAGGGHLRPHRREALMEIARRRWTLLRAALFTGVCVALIAAIGVQVARVSTGDGYRLVAVFDDVSGLVEGDQVKIAGAPVGQVEAIRVVDGRAEVTLEVRREITVPSDTEAAVRWRNAVGQRVVYLLPGTAPGRLAPPARASPAPRRWWTSAS